MACGIANAQFIKITPEGIKNLNSDSDYVVLNFENQDARSLYNKSVAYVNQKFKNPNYVIKSNIIDKSLRYSDYKVDGLRVQNGMAKINVDIKFDNDLSFKDGKVRFEFVDLNLGGITFKGNIWKGYPIWNEKNEKLRLEEEKKELELFFNSVIQEYFDYVNNNTNDDW